MVAVTATEADFVLANDRLAIRLARRFPPGPILTGPILGVQPAGGPWLGRQTLSGASLASASAAVTDRGAGAVYEARLELTGGGRYELSVELLPGESHVRVAETMAAADAVMRFELEPFAPTALALNGLPGYPAVLADPATHRAPYGVVPGVLASLGAQSIFGQIGTPWLALGDGKIAVSFAVCRGGDWRFPGDNTLRLVREEGRLALRGEVRHGSREWLLVAGRAADWMPRPGESCDALAALRRRVSDLPPGKVATWVLDLADPEPEPLLWTDLAGVKAARTRLNAPPWTGLSDSFAWRPLEQRLYAENESACMGLTGTTDSFPQGIAWLRSGDPADGTRLAQEIAAWAGDAAERFRRQGFLGAGLDVVHLRALKQCLYWYDLLRGSGAMPAATADAIRRALLFCAYCQFDRDYFDYESACAPADSEHSLRRFLLEEDYSDTMGCQNFHADIYTFLGAMGLAFPAHPAAAAWVAHAEAMARLELECFVAPDGTYVESDTYFIHFLGLIYYFAFALSRRGRRALLDHPRLRAGLNYFVRSQTPPLRHTGAPETAWYGTYTDQPRARPIVQVPPLGDAGLNWGGQACPSFLHHAAASYAGADPALAGAFEWTWQRAGRPLAHCAFLIQEAVSQPGAPAPPRPVSLASCELEGHGAMLRADVGQPRETAILISGGRATSHMHFDAGSFLLWHAGVPLVVDPGYIHEERTPARQYGGDSWKHSTVTFGAGWNGDLGLEHRPPLLAFRSLPGYDYVACDLSQNNQRDGVWRAIRRTVSLEHYRQFLFAHNRYLLIKDRIYRSVHPATWRLWVLADGEEIAGARVQFRGRYGVDLLVTFLEPAAPTIRALTFSKVRGIAVELPPETDALVLLQPLLPEEAPCRAGLADGRLQIEGAGWSEQVLLDPLPGQRNASWWHRERAGGPGRPPRCAIIRDGIQTILHEG